MTTTQAQSHRPALARFEAFSSLFTCAFDGIAVWEPDPWRVAYANPTFWELIGIPAEAPGDKPASDDVPAGLRVRMADLLDRFGEAHSSQSTVTEYLDAGLDGKPIEVRLCQILHGDQQFVGMIVRAFACGQSTERDTTASARRDPLTGLCDSEFLRTRLATLLEGERVADRQFAVVFLDLDNFKQVNDEFGHLVGDDVLREAARRIAGCLRAGDHVVRFGGDEFVAIVEGVSAAHEVEPVIGRMQMALARPIELPTCAVTLSLSAGVALASEAGRSPEGCWQRLIGLCMRQSEPGPSLLLGFVIPAAIPCDRCKSPLLGLGKARYKQGVLPAQAAASLALFGRRRMAIFAAF